MESISTQVFLAYIEHKASCARIGVIAGDFEVWMRNQRKYIERINEGLYYDHPWPT